jgi:GT2 family glycosyltransferase
MNEDVDLGLKVARHGRIMFCPQARLGHYHAPGGRVSPAQAAEDDLHNRYLILRRTRGQSRIRALGFVVLFFLVETMSNLVGGFRKRQWEGFWPRLVGHAHGLIRILMGIFRGVA